MLLFSHCTIPVEMRFCPFCRKPIYDYEENAGEGACPSCGKSSDTHTVRTFQVKLCLDRSTAWIEMDDFEYMQL